MADRASRRSKGAGSFDLLVVGGGINGAGTARDAAGRGLRTLLCEQHDLASHTSSASTKLIHGGLRYQDTDTEREQEGSESGIFEDLRWLGLDWDEGPDRGGPVGPYRQSERGDHYLRAVERLLAGGRGYRCFCSEELLEADRKSHVGYSGRCREIERAASDRRAAAGEPHAIRFRTIPPKPSADDLVVRFHDRLREEVTFPAIELGDPVLVRLDDRPTYNFAVFVDDLAMGITLVLRGDDHLSTRRGRYLLFRALGGTLPEFAHLPMVRGSDGERLSKRHGATSVSEFRRMGYPPEALLNERIAISS